VSKVGPMSWSDVTDFLGNKAVERGLGVVAIVVVAFVLSHLLRRAVNKVEARVAEETTPLRTLQRTHTLTKIASGTGIVFIWVIASFQILSTLVPDFNLAPLLASVGIVGLAVGFGAQSLVKDVVTGFFILLEDQYGVGDIIEINQEAAGVVEQLTVRVTGLRALDGTMHFIANGNIVHVANRSKDWARAIVDVGVAYKERSDKVRATLEEVADRMMEEETELSRVLYSRPEVMGVEMLGEYEVLWRIKADTKPGRQWEVARAMREQIKLAFDNAGIEIPFPHRVMVSADSSKDKPKPEPEAKPEVKQDTED
jgi:small-conductance mechanosensitive channel